MTEYIHGKNYPNVRHEYIDYLKDRGYQLVTVQEYGDLLKRYTKIFTQKFGSKRFQRIMLEVDQVQVRAVKDCEQNCNDFHCISTESAQSCLFL